jgi:hypothetical protein
VTQADASHLDPSIRSTRRALVAAFTLALVIPAAIAAEFTVGWFEPTFRFASHLLYEKCTLAEIRRPSQIPLARLHLLALALLVAIGAFLHPAISRHARRFWIIFCIAYALRALAWIAGGNLPLVPGDSCHYVEVARSVYRGEGPVKHYVESFFRDYRPHGILDGRGVLDDWATPLWAYVLAASYRITGVVPGESIESTFAVAKGTSFLLNLLTLPVLYAFARRRYGPRVALASMAVLAILPVHVIYAGFALRESLVVLLCLLAVWAVTELEDRRGPTLWIVALLAGVLSGLAILARNTAIVLAGASLFYALVAYGRARWAPLALAALTTIVTIAPWAWATWREYGEPFYTYTKYYPYNFSWTVHHYDQGNTRPDQFFTPANLSAIVRVKIRSLLVVLLYSFMILSAPLALGFFQQARPRAGRSPRADRPTTRLIAFLALAFLAATLWQTSDVTQVQQLARYYAPLYVLMLPGAVSGVLVWMTIRNLYLPSPALAVTLAGLLWADPTWAYDASWYSRPFQNHWPALEQSGRWILDNPEAVPSSSRILTWFPWELRVTSDRTTILFPRALEAGPYEVARIQETIRQYNVTHVLWGSFEPTPEADPETLGPYLENLRKSIGLTDSAQLYRSPRGLLHPVRLYRLQSATP